MNVQEERQQLGQWDNNKKIKIKYMSKKVEKTVYRIEIDDRKYKKQLKELIKQTEILNKNVDEINKKILAISSLFRAVTTGEAIKIMTKRSEEILS